MTCYPDTIYHLQKRDIPRAAAVLAEAFRDDPVWKAALGEAADRQWLAVFEFPLRYCLKYGEIMAPSGRLEGVAMFLPDIVAAMPLRRLLASGSLLAGLSVGIRIAFRMRRIFAPVHRDRAAAMRGRHYLYVPVIGIAPGQQGRGFGRQLLQTLICRSEEQGVPLYIETEKETNLPFYRKFGFTIRKKVILAQVSLPLWEMVREPGGKVGL